jgi:molybdopterin converting factor small subunit
MSPTSPSPAPTPAGQVKLLFFSVLQDLTATEETWWPIPESGLTVRALIESVSERWPTLRQWQGRLLVAVDLEYASLDDAVRDGQEVAFMPPVQGG